MSHSQRLDAVCEIAMGQAPSGDAYNHEGKGWPLIAGAGDFGETYPVCKKYTAEAARLSKYGDIVLGIRASIGEKVIADGEYCLGRGVAGLRGKSNLDSRYLWHWLTHTGPVLASKAKGATFKQVNKDDIGELEIILPALPEQRRIAAILDQADALRAKRREALAQLDSLTQSIFIEMFGDPSTNSKNWDVVRLSDEVSIQGGFAFKSSDYVSSGIPLIRIGDVNRSSGANENQCFLPKYWAEKYSRFLIHPGSLLMSLTGTTGKDDYGNVVVLSNHFCEYFLNQRVACIKPIGDRISKAFLHSFLKDKKVKSLIVSKSRGVRQANISNGDILELSLPVPPLKLQVKYSECIDQLESLKFQHKNSSSELNTLFASLQHRAFRGEL